MAWVQVTYWRDIPVLVRARAGSEEVTLPLGPRFQELVDTVAMQEGASATADYLAAWRTGPEEERPGSPREASGALAAELEAGFTGLRQRYLGRGDPG